MAYDAFTRFPRRFSARPALAKSIYRSLKRGLGDSFEQDFDGSPVQARLYAQSMGMAQAMRVLRRVRDNSAALTATDLLANLENIYGIVPATGSLFRERRRNLHARMSVVRGGRYEAVMTILHSLLGADFEEWATATLDNLVRFPEDVADVKATGNYVPPGTAARILVAPGYILSGTQTVPVEELTPASGSMVGRTLLVDPQSISRRETVVVDAVTLDDDERVTSITATFSGPHDAGSYMTAQYFPTMRSTAQHHFVKATLDAASNQDTRRRVSNELRRAMKGVATWDIGVDGGFAPDEGLVGVTAIGDDDDPAAWVRDIVGDIVVAYWGPHLTDFKQDVSGNGNHLILVGAEEPASYTLDGIGGGVVLTEETELECDDIATIASGTNKPFTVAFWGQRVSGRLAVWMFEKSDGDAKHYWDLQSTMAGPLFGVARIDDDANSEIDATDLATDTERFFFHTFAAAGSANNILQVDGTVQNPALNVNPTTFNQFRLAALDPGMTAGEFRVARVLVLSDSITEEQASQIRAGWQEQSS
jgi:hypothetical protein